MKTPRVLLWLAMSCPLAVLAADKPDFAPYQDIINRAPFGRTDSNIISATTSNFLSRFAFVGVFGPTGQLQAVIFDKQTNQSHFKAAGETIEDITIVGIEDNPPKRRLLLRRGLETGALTFGEGGPAGKSMPATVASGQPPPLTQQPPSSTQQPQPPIVARRRNPFIR